MVYVNVSPRLSALCVEGGGRLGRIGQRAPEKHRPGVNHTARANSQDEGECVWRDSPSSLTSHSTHRRVSREVDCGGQLKRD